MASAYTPGLKVTSASRISKVRRLPIPGEVLVQKGARVHTDTPVAKANIPGNPQSINVANILGVEAEDIEPFMQKKAGDTVEKDETLALAKSFFGLFKTEVKSPVSGTVEHISEVTGQVIIREPAMPITMHAYIEGTVVDIIEREGVTVETKGAFIQGIFGVGGEREGILKVVVEDENTVLDAHHINDSHEGCILVGGSLVTYEAIQKAAQVGARGIVVGGIIDSDLVKFLGYDIGVAITGHEDVPFTLITTEGFGEINMAHKTFELLTALDGKHASINGATQIRAGVMRPEIIVPDESIDVDEIEAALDGSMDAGTLVRCIREPYFGQLAEVVDFPPELFVIETGARVRIMNVRLRNGEIVTVPRANVELIEELKKFKPRFLRRGFFSLSS